MDNIVKFPGNRLRRAVAGGLLAGALGLGYGNGGYGHSESGGDYPATGDTQEVHGTGGSAGVTGMVEGASLPPNVAPGWKIRVCSEKTKAASLDFMITPTKEGTLTPSSQQPYGTGGSGAQDAGTSGTDYETGTGGAGMDTTVTRETATWQSGDPSLIILPEHLSTSEKIQIRITPDRKDAKSEVCVLYNDHVTKKITFDETNSVTVKMTDNGSCGC